jgi:hypothetical protein
MEDPQDIVSIYRAANSIEANLVKNWLEDEGIKAVVTEENDPLGGILTKPDVMVRVADEARAKSLIAEYEERLIEEVEGPAKDSDSDESE